MLETNLETNYVVSQNLTTNFNDQFRK